MRDSIQAAFRGFCPVMVTLGIAAGMAFLLLRYWVDQPAKMADTRESGLLCRPTW